MAKLLSVYKSDLKLTNRQIPLSIDNSLTIIMKIGDLDSTLTEATSCLACEQMKIAKKKDYENFMKKYSLLINNYHNSTGGEGGGGGVDGLITINDYLKTKFKFKTNDLLNSIQQLITCIGCRTSVEKFYKQLNTSKLFSSSSSLLNENSALDPLKINVNDGFIYLNNDYLNPKSLFNLFYIHGTKLDKILDAIPKNKKNRRCFLHSLDIHKIKNLNDWLEVWEIMDNECRKEILCVNNDYLLQTLENYLRKHRFCSDCKNKVIRAYNLLTGEIDITKEKGYCASLYDGLKVENKNVHVKSDKQYLMQLISRAEPELQGSNRERHAKTIDIAQEEVLTCIGIYLYEKFHRIYQAMKSEEQTWQLLFYIGVYTLKKCFEFEISKATTDEIQTVTVAVGVNKKKKLKNNNNNNKQQKKEKLKQDRSNSSNSSSNKENVIIIEKYENNSSNEDDEYDEEPALASNSSSSDTLAKIDAGYSSGQESNASSNEVCFSTDSLLCTIDQCKCHQDTIDIIACNEIIITQPKICGCDNQPQFDVINYSRIIEKNGEQQLIDKKNSITDEEKNEYYANKRFYLQERNAHRMQLKQKFQNLQILEIKPRNSISSSSNNNNN